MKALLLSALILVPSAGAATAVLPAPTQDFRVSYARVTLNTAPGIFVKSNLPQVLSDEELDGVTGENPFLPIGVVLVGRAAQAAAPTVIKVVDWVGRIEVAHVVATGESLIVKARDAVLGK
ncbi:hypothetical protein [Deinococcus sp.]|uniref:hypothetical protein n=1 Tax=Deinococcus sp. TaxID=47478 RepID=UPI0039193A4B